MKNKKEKKKSKKFKIVKLILLIILILFIVVTVILNIKRQFNPSTQEKNTITATKKEENYGTTTYEIEVENYDISKIKKTIEFSTYRDAKALYGNYELEKEYKNYELELKDKKVIVTMPKDVFLEEINYNYDRNVILVSNGQNVERVSQEEIINALTNQGYTVK